MSLLHPSSRGPGSAAYASPAETSATFAAVHAIPTTGPHSVPHRLAAAQPLLRPLLLLLLLLLLHGGPSCTAQVAPVLLQLLPSLLQFCSRTLQRLGGVIGGLQRLDGLPVPPRHAADSSVIALEAHLQNIKDEHMFSEYTTSTFSGKHVLEVELAHRCQCHEIRWGTHECDVMARHKSFEALLLLVVLKPYHRRHVLALYRMASDC